MTSAADPPGSDLGWFYASLTVRHILLTHPLSNVPGEVAVKIYLVTPRNPSSFWTYDRILPVLGRKCVFPNLSMPTLAGLTPREHEIVICDENVEPIDFDFDADIVGVTGYIVHQERMRQIVEEFRRRGRFVVVGGPHASLCPEDWKGRCDVLFVGEAEETWPAFLRDWALGAWKAEYRAEEKPDLSLAPKPRFDLLKVDRYHALTIQFARGCPFSCEFCDIIVMYGRRPRTKSVPHVMAEVEECRRLGARQIFVVDDNFIGNKKLAKELLREMGRWGREHGYPMEFNTEVSLNVAQEEPAAGVASGDGQDPEYTRRPRRQRAEDPHLRDPGAGRHDRWIRQRRHLDLRGAVALHPGSAHSRVDDRHVAGPAEDAASRTREQGGPTDRGEHRRSVRVLQHRAEADDPPAAL
jgi:hypothetical protein